MHFYDIFEFYEITNAVVDFILNACERYFKKIGNLTRRHLKNVNSFKGNPFKFELKMFSFYLLFNSRF